MLLFFPSLKRKIMSNLRMFQRKFIENETKFCQKGSVHVRSGLKDKHLNEIWNIKCIYKCDIASINQKNVPNAHVTLTSKQLSLTYVRRSNYFKFIFKKSNQTTIHIYVHLNSQYCLHVCESCVTTNKWTRYYLNSLQMSKKYTGDLIQTEKEQSIPINWIENLILTRLAV